MTIVVKELSVQIGKAHILSEVTLAVGPGTWCTVIGPNGAGKTSLLSVMAGLRRASSGAVEIDGIDIHALSERDRARRVAYVPQDPIVPPGMAARDYVTLGRTASHGLLRAPSRSDLDIVDGVIDRLGLGGLATRDVATLSGGERQRVVLARALAQGTRVVLLDEPTTGLDVRHQIEMLELLRKEVDECELTVVATLHDLTLAGLFADHMVLLHQGRVVETGAPSTVVRSSALSASYETSLQVIDVDGRDVVIPGRPLTTRQ